jgi:hypothetical protein
MDINNIQNDKMCYECLTEANITLGECENIYWEYGFKTVLGNGMITEFVEMTEAERN